MQLSGTVVNVKAKYQSSLDALAMWWQFTNLMFGIFALGLLAYNTRKFYEKNPVWKNYLKKDNLK